MKFRYLEFFSEKIDFLKKILVYFHWKSAFWVRPCLKTSLWRHTLTDFHDFGINGKRRPYPIPWYQTITLWARQFQVHKGVVTTPLVNHVTKKKRLGRTRVNEDCAIHWLNMKVLLKVKVVQYVVSQQLEKGKCTPDYVVIPPVSKRVRVLGPIELYDKLQR